MKDLLLDLLICPSCLPFESGLDCNITEREEGDIVSGDLLCGRCLTRYPISESIATILPGHTADSDSVSKYEKNETVASYMWSHYADLWKDANAGSAYRQWANLFREDDGISLDAGCAVGRSTFEMGLKNSFAIGIDLSVSFIKAARQVMKTRSISVSLPKEGLIKEQNAAIIPDDWPGQKIEFMVADVMALPFRSGAFSSLASLNLIDKVPLPLLHLKEMNRVASERGAQFLFSDPFSWSSEVAEEKDWLGGKMDGPFSGEGLKNVLSLLKGETGDLSPGWKVEKQGYVEWKIRHHQNLYEFIRSWYIKSSR